MNHNPDRRPIFTRIPYSRKDAPMIDLLLNPVVAAAIIGLLGVAVGAILRDRTDKRGDDLDALRTTVEVLRADQQDLREQLRGIRADFDHERKNRRVVQEKYSVSLTVIGTLKAGHAMEQLKASAAGYHLSPFPNLPESIRVDFETRQPEPSEREFVPASRKERAA